MKKTPLIAALIGLGIAGAVSLLYFKLKSKSEENSLVATQSWQIGQELVATTNSSRLSPLPLGVKRQLAEFLGSPARVEAVLLGDEPRPPEDPKALARIFLINEKNQRLGLRLQREPEPDRFSVLGFWIPNSPPSGE